MKHLIKCSSVVVMIMMLCISTSVVAASVSRIVVVETEDVAAYVAQIEKGRELLKKAGGSGKIRIWQASFAGPNTGNLVVAVEFENLQALAADNAKMSEDADVQAWLKELSAIRTIVSDSVYNEL